MDRTIASGRSFLAGLFSSAKTNSGVRAKGSSLFLLRFPVRLRWNSPQVPSKSKCIISPMKTWSVRCALATISRPSRLSVPQSSRLPDSERMRQRSSALLFVRRRARSEENPSCADRSCRCERLARRSCGTLRRYRLPTSSLLLVQIEWAFDVFD